MKQLILTLLLVTSFGFAQKKSEPVKYNYGQNGIELIVKKNNETIVVSTFQAKVTIKDEIAEKVYNYYSGNKNQKAGNIIIDGSTAKITGKYSVETKGNLVSVNFKYDKVEWQDGLVEVSN